MSIIVNKLVPAELDMIMEPDNQVLEKWQKKDQLAYAAICLQICNEYLVYIHGSEIANDIGKL